MDKNGDSEILASHILIKIDISPSTLNNLKREATLFSYDAQDTGFDSAIEVHNLSKSKVKKLGENDLTVKDLGNLRSMVRFAFNNKLSSISEVLENDKFYVVCSLDSIVPKGIKGIEEVESDIIAALKNEKAKAVAFEESNRILIEISSGEKQLSELIESRKGIDGFNKETKKISQGFPFLGRSNYISGAIASASIGKIIGPIETNKGYAILQVHEISKIDSTAFENQKSQIQNSFFRKNKISTSKLG